MKRRTAIFFSIFIIVAVIFILFAFVYRGVTQDLIDKYVAKITICGNILNEDDCYSKDFCEGIYTSSCPNCPQEFVRCQKIPTKTLIQLQQQQQVCRATGGEWQRNKLGAFCLCQKAGVNKFWDKKGGCLDKIIQ